MLAHTTQMPRHVLHHASNAWCHAHVLWLCLTLVLAWAGCQSNPPPNPPGQHKETTAQPSQAPRSTNPIDEKHLGIPQPVEFHGCTALRDSKDGPVCMLTPDDKMVFWVRDRACDSLAFAEGGQAISFTGSIVQGGCQARITSSTTQVHTALQISDRSTAQPIYSLSLDRSKPHLLEGTRRIRIRSGNDLEDIIPELQRQLDLTEDEDQRIDILYSLSFATRRIGDEHSSQKYLAAVMQEAQSASYRSIAFEAGYRRADQLEIAGMHDEARMVLRTMETQTTPGNSRNVTPLMWEYALLDRAELRFDAAADKISLAMLGMERVNDEIFERVAISIQTELLLRIGRTSDAERLLRRTEALLDGANDCIRADLSRGAAFIGQLMVESINEPLVQVPIRVGQQSLRALFLRALEAHNKCRNDAFLVPLYKGMATVEYWENRYKESMTWIRLARGVAQVGAIDDMELMDLEAKLALASRNGDEALRLYIALEDRSKKSPSHYRRWMECKYALGSYRALLLLGKDGAAHAGVIRSCMSTENSGLTRSDAQRFVREALAAGVTVH